MKNVVPLYFSKILDLLIGIYVDFYYIYSLEFDSTPFTLMCIGRYLYYKFVFQSCIQEKLFLLLLTSLP